MSETNGKSTLDAVVMWTDPSKELPKEGITVLVKGVVRYGRKEQVLAAKLMREFVSIDSFKERTYWIALKEGDNYAATIELRNVSAWRHIT